MFLTRVEYKYKRLVLYFTLFV